MRLSLSPEQQQIGATAADVLSHEQDGSIEARWPRYAELGWFSLGIPEARGGVGFGPVEEMLLFREIGRHLAPGPLLPTVIAGWVAVGAGRADLAGELFAGKARAGLATGEHVLDAEAGGWVVGPDDGGFALRDVVDLSEVASVDASVRLARATVSGPVARFADPCLLARAELLVAAMQVGIAEATRDMSVAHALGRTQFGRPIGAFQAVKHRCADMAIRAYAAYSQTLFAANHLERRSRDAVLHAAAATTMASVAARRNAADNVQNHGAIGFTQEHSAGWYVRRAQVLHQCIDPRGTSARVLAAPRHRYETLPDPAPDWFEVA